MESNKYPGAYPNSAELARATPHIRLSRPTPPDNTEWFDHDNQVVKEPARVCLCFDCQQPIEAGKGVQVIRHLTRLGSLGFARHVSVAIEGPKIAPMDAIVHPDCNLACGNGA